MASKYEHFMDEGTNKLMEILSSPSVDEGEKKAIVAAFSDELSGHISNYEELPDYDYVISSISLKYVDKKLSGIIANPNATVRELGSALALCNRQRELLHLFHEKSWAIPVLSTGNIDECEQNIKHWMETDRLSSSLNRLDHQIDTAIAKAEKDLSVESCNEVTVLLDELQRIVDSCGKKKAALPPIKNNDTKKLYKRIATLQKTAVQKEALHGDIAEVDAKLLALESMRNSTPIQWQEVISLCQTIKGYIADCKKKQWPVPTIRIGDPDKVQRKYTHYQSMISLDQSITDCSDYLTSKKQYKLYQGHCTRQIANIEICQKNQWPVPKLNNPNPAELVQISTQAKAQKERAQKLKLKLFAVGAAVIAVAVLMLFIVIKSREGKITVPFSSSYAIGVDCYDLQEELEGAGFTNIRIVEDDSGWLESNEVIGISVDNKKTFDKDEYYDPDVTVVITCSSSGRIDVAEHLKDWQTRPYTDVVAGLKTAGFTNITTTSKNTSDKAEDQLVATLNLNNSEYTNGHCYLPKDAPIDITYFTLKITMSNDNASFVGQNYEEVVESLTEDGFTNVQTEKINTGWAKGNSVIAVTINNQTSYNADDVYSPDVKIVVKYSSDDRVDATALLTNWSSKTYSDLQHSLRNAGFTNITTTEVETTTKTQNQKVAGISLNGQSFTGGDCFLQKNAPIQIKYYTLKIVVGSAASEIEGRNYSEVVKELKAMGFTNITLKRSNDLVLGWFSKEGNIKSISINGVSDFADDDSFSFDDEIVIVVHTYKNKGCEDITLVAD